LDWLDALAAISQQHSSSSSNFLDDRDLLIPCSEILETDTSCSEEDIDE
jgi:hypothetical protein